MAEYDVMSFSLPPTSAARFHRAFAFWCAGPHMGRLSKRRFFDHLVDTFLKDAEAEVESGKLRFYTCQRCGNRTSARGKSIVRWHVGLCPECYANTEQDDG